MDFRIRFENQLDSNVHSLFMRKSPFSSFSHFLIFQAETEEIAKPSTSVDHSLFESTLISSSLSHFHHYVLSHYLSLYLSLYLFLSLPSPTLSALRPSLEVILPRR